MNVVVKELASRGARWLSGRLKETSTWVGIGGLVALAGFPSVGALIGKFGVTGGTVLAGVLVGMTTKA